MSPGEFLTVATAAEVQYHCSIMFVSLVFLEVVNPFDIHKKLTCFANFIMRGAFLFLTFDIISKYPLTDPSKFTPLSREQAFICCACTCHMFIMNMWELIMEKNPPHLLLHHLLVAFTFGQAIHAMMNGMTEEMVVISALVIHACGYAAIPCFVFAFQEYIPKFIQKLFNFPIALAKLKCAIWVGAALHFTLNHWDAVAFKPVWISVEVVLIVVELHLFVQKCKRAIEFK